MTSDTCDVEMISGKETRTLLDLNDASFAAINCLLRYI